MSRDTAARRFRTPRCCASRCGPTSRPGSRRAARLAGGGTRARASAGQLLRHRRARHLSPARAHAHLRVRRASAAARGGGDASIAPITACSSPPLGAGQPTGTRQTVVSIPGEALACFYTDGVIEARVGRRAVRREPARADARASSARRPPPRPLSTAWPSSPTGARTTWPRACYASRATRLAPRVRARGTRARSSRRGARQGRALPAGRRPERASRSARLCGSVRAAVARHGGVVLELHLGERRSPKSRCAHRTSRCFSPRHARLRGP